MNNDFEVNERDELARAIIQINDLTNALERIVHNAGYGGWDLQSAYGYAEKILEKYDE